MPSQHVGSTELFFTDFTRIRLDMQMDDQMFAEIVRLLETFAANIANTGFFSGVNASMPLHVAQLDEGFAAKITLVLFRKLFYFT